MKSVEKKKERGDVLDIIVFSAHSTRKLWFWGFVGKIYLTQNDHFFVQIKQFFGPFSQKDLSRPEKIYIKRGFTLIFEFYIFCYCQLLIARQKMGGVLLIIKVYLVICCFVYLFSSLIKYLILKTSVEVVCRYLESIRSCFYKDLI